jgi:membrane dipeptidase
MASDLVTSVLHAHPVWDGHNDLPWAMREQVGYDCSVLDLAVLNDRTHTDIPRLRAGGVGAQFWSVFVPAQLAGDSAVAATLEQVDFVHQMTQRYAADLSLALTADDVDAAWSHGKIASLLGAEGGHSIGSSLGTLRMLYAVGVRYLTLTHNDNVPWADSATDEPVLGGLSEFGREVVREMNRLGMLVDCSHVSADTMRDALSTSSAPIIFSHSSARAVCDHPRNVPDDVLTSLATQGGVCMVTFVPKFVSPTVREWDLAAAEDARAEGIDPANFTEYLAFCIRRREREPQPVATIADVVAHCEHVREVAGIEHIGLGGDYDGVDLLPEGLDDVSGYPALLDALADQGWSADDLGALTSGNIRRVLADAEDVARAEQQRRDPSLATIADLDG